MEARQVAALGDTLREARVARGVSLSEAERDTKIRAKYLSALEDDNLTMLPGPVYARGFLRNYAQYLGIDPDEAMEMFDQQIQPTRTKIRAARGEPPQKRGKDNKGYPEKINIQPLSPQPVDTRLRYGSSYIAVSLLALPLLLVFYLIYSIWGVNRNTTLPIPTPIPPTLTPLSIPSQIPAAGGNGAFNTPTVAVAQPPAPLPPTQTPVPVVQQTPTAPRTDVTVKVTTTSDAWLQVTVDGAVQYSGTLPSGSSKQWTGKKTVRIRTGRADAVKVNVNGADRGTMMAGGTRILTKEWDVAGNEKIVK
jgi:cytoskeleton protein RodZ